MERSVRPPLFAALWRGGRKRCPNCGGGSLFVKWLEVNASCSVCGVALLENEGDPWAFVVLLDRIFVLVLLGVVYFKLGPPTHAALITVFASVIAVFILTTPNRFGCCLAIAYWLRVR